MNHYDVIVVGAGASGLSAAISASECGDRVLLLEAGDRIGRKIAASGNGRCNLFNTGSLRYNGEGEFANQLVQGFGITQLRLFWHRLGLSLITDDENRVYPSSLNSGSVLDVLKNALALRHIPVLTNSRVTNIKKNDGVFSITDEHNNRYSADRVILSCGSMAQPHLGGCDSGYRLAESFGHTIIPIKPALSQIETDLKSVSGLKGIRVISSVTLYRNHQRIAQEDGEVLFTDFGVSGICIMQLAGKARKGDSLTIDLSRCLGSDDQGLLLQVLKERRSTLAGLPAEAFLSGWFVQRLSYGIMKKAQIEMKNRLVESITDRELESLYETIKSYRLQIEGIKGFEQAQVTAGGVACSEFDPENLESRKIHGLFCTGETLNVDGDCGGFNLMFAAISGIIAGRNKRE